VRPEYAGDYELVGALPWNEEQAAIDHERAFANLAPLQ
jgi:hypothetical protein